MLHNCVVYFHCLQRQATVLIIIKPFASKYLHLRVNLSILIILEHLAEILNSVCVLSITFDTSLLIQEPCTFNQSFRLHYHPFVFKIVSTNFLLISHLYLGLVWWHQGNRTICQIKILICDSAIHGICLILISTNWVQIWFCSLSAHSGCFNGRYSNVIYTVLLNRYFSSILGSSMSLCILPIIDSLQVYNILLSNVNLLISVNRKLFLQPLTYILDILWLTLICCQVLICYSRLTRRFINIWNFNIIWQIATIHMHYLNIIIWLLLMVFIFFILMSRQITSNSLII